MKASAPLLALLFLAAPIYAQQNPFTIACGVTPADYSVKHTTQFSPQQVPPGKALVYIIESMPTYTTFYTEKVNIGLDGAWLGATDVNTYISFTIDPGVHHLCAVYQGEADPMDDGDQTLLLHLDAKADKTYYLRYHAFFLKETPGIASFAPIDEDEGLYLLQRSELAVSKLKK